MRNADFTVAQLGTTFNNVVAGFTLDRWYVSHGAGANKITQQDGFGASAKSIKLERYSGGPISLYQALPSVESKKCAGGNLTFGVSARGDGTLNVMLIGGKGDDQASSLLGTWTAQSTLVNTAFSMGSEQRCAVTASIPSDVTQLAVFMSWTGNSVEIAGARLNAGTYDLTPLNDNDAEEIACRTFFERLNRVMRPSIIAPLLTYNQYAGSGRVSFLPKRHDNYTLGLSGSMNDYHVLATDGSPITPTAIILDGHKTKESFWVRVEWLQGGVTIPGGTTFLVSDATANSRFDIDANL